HLQHARSIGGSLPFSLTAHVPVLGTPARAVASASRAGLDVASAADLVVDAADAFPTQGSAGIDGHDLSIFYKGSSEATDKLKAADSLLAAASGALDGPAGAWLPLISSQAVDMRDVV